MRLFRLNSENGKMDSLLELSSDYQNSVYKHHPILSANGSLLYYIEGGNRNLNSSQLYALDMEAKQETKIASFDSPDITSFSASPDGQYLSMVVLYQQQKGRPSALQLLNLSSGEKRELFKTPWGDATKFFGLGWSHDAKYIYYVRSNPATSSSFVWRIEAEGGVPQKTGLTMIDIRMPQVHPDGKHIFFYGGKGWYNKTYEIRAINAAKNFH
jgi:Tol biopolymer transport system component